MLEPAIRQAMGIEDKNNSERLANTIIVLDEAHNVEDVLRESGSMKITEIELGTIMVTLSNIQATAGRMSIEPHDALPQFIDEVEMTQSETTGVVGLSAPISEVVHVVVLFMDKLLDYFHQQKNKFETQNFCGVSCQGKQNPGAVQVLQVSEWSGGG